MSTYLVRYRLNSQVFKDVFGDDLTSVFDLPDLKQTNIKDKKAKDIYSTLLTQSKLYNVNATPISDVFGKLEDQYGLAEGSEACCVYMDRQVDTYKFLGMDIADDFCAYIKTYSGSIRVESLYNRDLILKSRCDFNKGTSKISRNKAMEIAEDVFSENGVGYDIARAVVTALKCGGAYSIASGIKKLNIDSTEDAVSFLSKSVLGDIVRNYTGGVSSQPADSVFDSIVYNIVKDKVNVQTMASSDESVDDVVFVALKYLFYYWGTVAGLYSRVKVVLGSLDTLTYIARLQLGDTEFFARYKTIYEFRGMDESEEFDIAPELPEQPAVGFSLSGIVKTHAYTDYLATKSASDIMLNMDNIDYLSEFTDILVSNVDDYDQNSLGDNTVLSDEELQALSNIDALRYMTSDDSSLNPSAYDLSDKDERDLYFDSVVRTYDKKFKAYKPTKDTPIVDSLLDTVEKGTINSLNLIARDAEDDGVTDIISLTGTELQIDADKKMLRRILMLVHKLSTKLLKKFL